MRFHLVGSTLLILLALGTVVAAADSSGADLLKAAKSGDQDARLQAIDLLGIQGSKIKGAVPVLMQLLRDRSPAIRARAAHALGVVGPEKASIAMRPLVRAAIDRDETVRREAFKAIRMIRPGSPIALGLLKRALKNEDFAIRVQALEALTQAGPIAVPFLIRALHDDETAYWATLALSEIAVAEIGRAKSDSKVDLDWISASLVPALIEAAKDGDKPEEQREAIITLAMIGPASAPGVPVFTEFIEKRDMIHMGPSIFAIGRIGPDAKEALPVLKSLDKDLPKLRADTEKELADVKKQLDGQQTPDEKKESLAKAAELSGRADFLKIATAGTSWAMARVDAENKELAAKAIPLLAEQLTSPRPEIREFAVHALVDLKPDPEIARPAINKALESASPEVLDHVVGAFISIRDAAVPELIDVLEDEKISAARPRVAAALGKMGPKAKDAIPALIKVAADKNPQARREALFALANIGAGKDAVPVAIKALDDEDEQIPLGACFLLGKIGPDAIDAKGRLVKNLTSDDPMLATVSAWALTHIDPTCEETCPKCVPPLTAALDHHNLKIQLEAIESLGRLGPMAKSALPGLKKLADDGNPLVSKSATEAIKAIEK